MNAHTPADHDGITITDLAQAHSALLLIRASLDREDCPPAALDLMRATTEFFFSLEASPVTTRPPASDPDLQDFSLLRIETPRQAESAALLIESGLNTAASLPAVIPATRRVLSALLAYIEAIAPPGG